MTPHKILTVGNSFAVDTLRHVPDIAAACGYPLTLGNLYVGGCSIRMHHAHAEVDEAVYTYYTHPGEEWITAPGIRLSDALHSDDWDCVTIWPGTKDGSRHTDPESYALLPALVDYIRAHTRPDIPLAYNLTWVGEPDSTRPELAEIGGDQLLLLSRISEITRTHVASLVPFFRIAPMGTAVQNARSHPAMPRLTRDGYHLSKDLGRYIAGLTFFGALTGMDISGITWVPEGVDENARAIANEAARLALASPFTVTPMHG